MPGPSQATQLADLAFDRGVELFHTPAGVVYATMVLGNGHRETWPVRGSGFRLWLGGIYYMRTKGAPNAQALIDALGILEARGRFEGQTIPVATRLTVHDGTIYLDLADEEWRVVAIRASGWAIEMESPVRFRRPGGMQPLPIPARGGDVDALREFINIGDDEWPLLLGYVVGALRPDRPFPILALLGEPGSGKSTQGEMVRSLIDPNIALLRSPPREEIDLVLQAVNGWVCGYDNLSFMPDWLSDALCRLSTGAAFGRRALWTNDEEALFATKRPVIYTAIGDIAARSDLAERTIAVLLPRITRHLTEAALWSAFHRARPRILGALLDAVSEGLRNLPRTELVQAPRMADFATWVTAAEPAFGWTSGTFLRAYDRSRESAHAAMLEASAVGQAVLTFMSNRDEWTGNAKALLVELDAVVDDATRRDHRHWPSGDGGPRALSGRLRTIGKDLRAAGIEVDYFKSLGAEKRVWVLRRQTVRSGDGLGTVGSPAETIARARVLDGLDGPDGPSPTPQETTDAADALAVFPGARVVGGKS